MINTNYENGRLVYALFRQNHLIKRQTLSWYRSYPLLLLLTLLCSSFASQLIAQEVSLNVNRGSFQSVMKDVQKQSGYSTTYARRHLQQAQPVTVNFKNKRLSEALNLIFQEQPFSYVIEGKIITTVDKSKNNPKPAEKLNTVRGRVVDETGSPLAGASIKVKDQDIQTSTNQTGTFLINNAPEGATLIIGYMGFESREIESNSDIGTIVLSRTFATLDVVDVTVSTGYQNLPRERATGSFAFVDQKTIERSVTPNILDRLEGVVSGMIFNKNRPTDLPNNSPITVRGRSTLFANAEPLIIVDNFPYEGDLTNINPNDIETISVLKDAAAASAWGSRSGNGVIVITTKKGALESKPTVSLTSNLTISSKPDLYDSPQISTAQYLEVEQFLFNKGAFDSRINNGYDYLTPAVDIFLGRRNGTISVADSLARINQLKSYDVRDDLSKYLYRNAFNQQYQASIAGGGATNKYYFSTGFDQNKGSKVNDQIDRFTLNMSNTWLLLNKRLELFSNITYTSNKSDRGGNMILPTPYARIADENGNAINIPYKIRDNFNTESTTKGLLDWNYRPLDEIRNGWGVRKETLSDYRINSSASYKIIDGLKASALYSFQNGIYHNQTLNPVESFFARDLINTYTQIDPVTKLLTYPVPVGGILDYTNSKLTSHNGRFQINLDKKWNLHSINAIAGTEIRTAKNERSTDRFYGYDDETKLNQNNRVNYNIVYPYSYSGSSDRVPNNSLIESGINNYISYYTNMGYAYNDRYLASFSARKDESNIFGVNSNQKGVPLWSAGLGWIISKESFFKVDAIQYLKLRGTFGYTGNVNNSLSALLTTNRISSNVFTVPFSAVVNPPNPSLKWEKIKNINIGLDFSLVNNRINGSVDYWKKTGLDLLGNSTIAPQTGIVQYTGNSANTITKGVDLQLNSINLNGAFSWYTTLLYNYTDSKVTKYLVTNGSNLNVITANYNNPIEGYPYYSLFSFRYAGLDNVGDPQGYINGEVSKNFNGIANSLNRDDLVYHGSLSPTHFGSLKNTFAYKQFDISFILNYKFGYYFRRVSLNNSGLYTTSVPAYSSNADYDLRWQKTGDELITDVPSLIYPANFNRTNLYRYSDRLVEKADNIRLQDIRIGYNLNINKQSIIKRLNIYGYASNLGFVWRANKQNLDPDYPAGIPLMRNFSLGLRADF